MKKFIYIIMAQLFLLFTLSGCLEDSAPAVAPSLAAPSSWFSGVTAVTNLGGSPITIKLDWVANVAAAKYNIYLLSKDATSNIISWILIDTVTNPASSTYVHRNPDVIKAGTLYTYRVNAVDFAGNEDPNQIQKSTLAFEGIKTVEILSRTSAKVQVNTAGSFSQIQVTATPTRVSNYSTLTANQVAALTKAVTLQSSNPEATLTGLLPGTTYSFKALALVDASGLVDGNNVIILKQTPSDSFGKGLTTETLSDYQYRNIRLMQAFGDAPNELNRTNLGNPNTGADATDAVKVPADLTSTVNPHERMVLIVPNPFSGDANNSYRVTRTAGVGLSGSDAPSVFDNATTTVCKKTIVGVTEVYNDTTCVVCDHIASPTTANVLAGDCDLKFTNSVPPSFIDKSTAPPKKKYYYNIAKVTTQNTLAWVEELPLVNATDFYFAAHIPDPYMVLIQRDSVNYEMCSLMPNKPSNPKKFNRCAYSGIGARPRTTLGEERPSLENGYYDFGYNLIADRHALACKWTGSELANTSINNTSGAVFGNSCDSGANSVCLSLALNAGGTASTSDGVGNIAPNASRLNATGANAEPYFPTGILLPTNVTAYVNNPKVLMNTQNAGANCYAAFYDPTTLASGNNTLVTAPSAGAATWTQVGELANIALSKTSNASTNTLISSIRSIVSNATTADPGPLYDGFSNRKRPALTGLSNTQAVALCNAQTSSYGTKRLLRRREFVAATPLPSFPGEPGFVSKSEKSRVESGVDGQTLYNYERHPDPTSVGGANAYFGAGTDATLNTNPGGCASRGNDKAYIGVNPNYYYPLNGVPMATPLPHNTTVSKMNRNYCPDIGGCYRNIDSSEGFNINGADYSIGRNSYDPITPAPIAATGAQQIQFNAYLTNLHNVMNETSRIVTYYNPAGAEFFIGSLATNKCKSRFGMQDPFSSALNVLGGSGSNGGGFRSGLGSLYGFILSDTFRQTATGNKASTAPAYEPVSNLQDQGAVYDYKIKNGTTLTNISISTDTNSAYTFTSRNGNQNLFCRQVTPIDITYDYQADNYFYLNDRTSTANDVQACRANSVLMNNTPSRSQTDFAGFLPVLGLPISINISTINSFQDYTPFTTMIYNKEFSDDVSGFRTYNRFYTSDTSGNQIVNMSSGSGSRWTYELSQSATTNNGGQAWCAVEAE